MTCQQQPRINYKRRVYSADTKGTPGVPSLGDRGGYRTPTTLGYATKTESKQLYLTHRNKQEEAVKMRKQRNIVPMKKQIKTPEKELNKMEISNLSDAKFKTL